MKIKGAIFDFDGTLFDSMQMWNTAADEYLRSIGREPAPGLRDAVKAMSLRRAAEYLQKHELTDVPCRFDVIEIENGKINHIENAFQA